MNFLFANEPMIFTVQHLSVPHSVSVSPLCRECVEGTAVAARFLRDGFVLAAFYYGNVEVMEIKQDEDEPDKVSQAKLSRDKKNYF